jgi:hypothetical protein
MMQRSLVGTWTLVSWEFRDADGNVSYPFGRDASGYLTYAPDGYMWATIVSPNRVAFASPDLRKATINEKVAAFDTYVSYCGTYELNGDTVIHHVRASLFPNWVGGDQKRIIEWVGDNLRLSTPPMPIEGKTQTVHLLWRHLEASFPHSP